MDLIFQSNKSSQVLSTLTASPTGVWDNTYQLGRSQPNLVKGIKVIQSRQNINGPPASQEVSFDIPRSGILRDMMLQTDYTISVTTNEIATSAVGLQLFEWVQFRSNNKTLMNLSDSYIMARTTDSPIGKSIAIFNRALPKNPTTFSDANVTTDLSKTVFTPLFSSFFEDITNNYDLSFWEQFQVVARFNTTSRAGLANPLTSATVSLWMWYYTPDLQALDIMRTENMNPSVPLQMLTYSTFRESIVCQNTTFSSIKLNSTFPTRKLFFYVRDNTGTVSSADSFFTQINKYDFQVGGSYLHQGIPRLIAKWEAESHGNSSGVYVSGITSVNPTTISKLSNYIMCIDFGIDTMDRINNSGLCSFNQLNAPTLTVYYNALTAANFDLIVCHEYLQVLSLDSANSTVSVVASN